MTDDAVREIHGVRCRDNLASKGPSTVRISETDQGQILIRHDDSNGAMLTRWQARYLASKLYRLARRLQEREV